MKIHQLSAILCAAADGNLAEDAEAADALRNLAEVLASFADEESDAFVDRVQRLRSVAESKETR
jgi:hypothetical protein